MVQLEVKDTQGYMILLEIEGYTKIYGSTRIIKYTRLFYTSSWTI